MSQLGNCLEYTEAKYTTIIIVIAIITFATEEHHGHRSASWGPRALLSYLIQGAYLLANKDGMILFKDSRVRITLDDVPS